MALDLMKVATGEAFRGSGDKDAEAAREAALAGFDIPLPYLQQLQLKGYDWLQDLKPSTVDAGEDVRYDPATAALAQLHTMDRSAMEDVATDPRLQQQQMASLAALQQIADAGGMTAQDQANLARIQSQAAQADRGRRDAILQGMRSRGMGGSGAELLAQLQSSQAATDRQAQEGLDVAGMAQARALDALMQGGNLAGSIRGQDFDEQAKIAAARDAVAQFNAAAGNQNSQFNAGQTNSMSQFNTGNDLRTKMYNRDTTIGVATGNANRTQDAGKFNLTGRQAAADSRTNAANDSQKYNVGIPQQQFQNKVTLATGKAPIYGQQAAAATASADKREDSIRNLIAGGIKAGAGAL